VQKYEKGTHRIGASRLQHIASIQQVPISFLFEGAPGSSHVLEGAPSSAYVSDFFATSDGLALTKVYMHITSTARCSRRKIFSYGVDHGRFG
jgi:hypothetical protein